MVTIEYSCLHSRSPCPILSHSCCSNSSSPCRFQEYHCDIRDRVLLWVYRCPESGWMRIFTASSIFFKLSALFSPCLALFIKEIRLFFFWDKHSLGGIWDIHLREEDDPLKRKLNSNPIKFPLPGVFLLWEQMHTGFYVIIVNDDSPFSLLKITVQYVPSNLAKFGSVNQI